MIIIPMAGLSSRFTKAGYDKPKYMLPISGKTVFTRSIESFSSSFETTPFVFIAREVADTKAFISAETERLGIRDVRTVILDHETAGQAETVEFGIRTAGVAENIPLTIFNIDTFRKDFCFPDAPWFASSDGYLEVFIGQGENWSYVGPKYAENEPLVERTTEKQPISTLCSNGLYHFSRSEDFLYALNMERSIRSANELYVAPLYNHLIQAGRRIHYALIPPEDITFCGVPSEYEALVKYTE